MGSLTTMTRQDPSRAALRAAVLHQRFTLDLARAAEVALGPSLTATLDVRLLVQLREADGLSATELVDRLGEPRSTVARALGRLRDEGMVLRGTHPQDARVAQLRLSAVGARRFEQYVAATAQAFRRHASTVEKALVLLGRDPQDAPGHPVTEVLAAAQRLDEAGAALAADVRASVDPRECVEGVDRAALLVLAECGPSRPGLLATEVGLSPAGVTSLTDRLVVRGLARRDRGVDGDGRAVVVSLTAGGSAAVGAYLEVFQRHHEAVAGALALALPHSTHELAAP